MTKTDKRILACAIMRQTDGIPHPVLAVSVTDRFAYLMDKMPNRKGNGGSCIRYRHNCEGLDLEQHFEQGGTSLSIHLTSPEPDDYDKDEDNPGDTVTPADLTDRRN